MLSSQICCNRIFILMTVGETTQAHRKSLQCQRQGCTSSGSEVMASRRSLNGSDQNWDSILSQEFSYTHWHIEWHVYFKSLSSERWDLLQDSGSLEFCLRKRNPPRLKSFSSCQECQRQISSHRPRTICLRHLHQGGTRRRNQVSLVWLTSWLCRRKWRYQMSHESCKSPRPEYASTQIDEDLCLIQRVQRRNTFC